MIKLYQSKLSNNWKFNPEIIKKAVLAKEKIANKLPWWAEIDYGNLLSESKDIFNWLEKKFSKLLVLWIWWSALWTSSVQQALWKEKVIVLDNLDPEFSESIFDKLNWEETLINVVSKSWNTIETNTQLSAVEKILLSKWLKLNEHLIITTWIQDNQLRRFAEKNKIKILNIPEEVWWRFSVFTWVSLFPLLFAWINIDEFLKWAIEWIEDFQNDFEENIPLKIAISQYEAYKNENKNIAIYKTYSRKLIWLLDWNRQLLAESIWKSREIWITPIINLWSTDQHSQLQLHLEWPKDKHITFLSTSFPDWPSTCERDDFLHIKTFWQVQQAFLEWTKKSFTHYWIWYQEIFIDEIDEKNIAKFMIYNMIAIWVLWELFEINAYDQPAVEFGKIKAKEIINEK